MTREWLNTIELNVSGKELVLIVADADLVSVIHTLQHSLNREVTVGRGYLNASDITEIIRRNINP